MLRGQTFKNSFTRATHTNAALNRSDDFFRFSRGRFVCDETHEMSQRHIESDMNELCSAAAVAVGSSYCSNIEKCSDGMYNKAFVLTMEDGKQVIAKVPNLNAGRPHCTTASEVATMDLARNDLGIPVPRVITWSSNFNNAIGAVYIIMEKAKGVPLEQVWPGLDFRRRAMIVRAIARYLKICSNKSFSRIGSLYYTNDIPNIARTTPLYVDRDSEAAVKSDRFAIGPITAREWIDNGRGLLHCDRGPWTSALDYRKAMAHKEIAAIREPRQLPKTLMMLCGPGLYQPSVTKKLKTLDSFMKILPYILPEVERIAEPYIWHNDLHAENIFVDPEDPSQILSIIDWQSVSVAPLFDHTIVPAFLNYDGSNLHPFKKPSMPATPDNKSENEQSIVMQLFYSDSLAYAFKILLENHIKPVFQALAFQESPATDILVLARRLFEIGEAHEMSLILALRDKWHELPLVIQQGHPPFPLTFSDADVAEIEDSLQMAIKSQELMNKVKESLGDLFPERGIVRHEQYIEAKSELRHVKAQILEPICKQSTGAFCLGDGLAIR